MRLGLEEIPKQKTPTKTLHIFLGFTRVGDTRRHKLKVCATKWRTEYLTENSIGDLIIFRFLGIINREYFITYEDHNFFGVQSLRLCRGAAN